jgi:hypothetical protein
MHERNDAENKQARDQESDLPNMIGSIMVYASTTTFVVTTMPR